MPVVLFPLLPVLSATLPAEANSYAKLGTCVPDTLGSAQFRKYQSFAVSEGGRITQPINGGLCLTVTPTKMLQFQPTLDMQPCSEALAANQTWSTNLTSGRIVQRSTGMCIDVHGGKATPGVMLHMWSCVPSSSPAAKNQQFSLQSDGAFASALTVGLCIDTSSYQTYIKPCSRAPANASRWCDRSLSARARAGALVAAATAGGNRTVLTQNLEFRGPGFAALGVPAPAMGEALHGVCAACLNDGSSGGTHAASAAGALPSRSSTPSTGCATSFPHALALSR